MTATDLMAATGLSRPAIHKVCASLVELGWIRENSVPGTPHSPAPKDGPGRPPRYYSFAADAGAVLSVDFGVHTIRAILADLDGKPLAVIDRVLEDPGGANRAHVLEEVGAAAVGAAGIAPDRVKIATVAVPRSLSSNPQVRYPSFQSVIDIAEGWARKHGWTLLVENDANLAAVAEHLAGVAQSVDNVIVLLAGERLGAGIIMDGELVRGEHGSAGELRFLALMQDMGPDTAGAGWHTRELAQQALTEGWATAGLRDAVENDGGVVLAPTVFRAAEQGDPSATRIVHSVSERLARIIGVLATIVDPALVVLSGGIADAGDLLTSTIQDLLPTWVIDNPPRVAGSLLGSEAVVTGGVSLGLKHLELHLLDGLGDS